MPEFSSSERQFLAGIEMNPKVKALLERLEEIEDELREELHKQSQEFQYQLEGTKVKFDQAVASAHEKLRTGLLTWFKRSSIRNMLSAPFIYSMIFPIALLDLTVTCYQAICFRLYGIPAVRRSKYIVIDRHYLSFLNGIEKFNCVYCGYANGVISYAREIISRTEQYWCPIKHARKTYGSHRRYAKFIDYGNAEGFRDRLEEFRNELRADS